MIRAIQIGNVNVPILATNYVDGSPGGSVPYQIPNNEKPEWIRTNVNSQNLWRIYSRLGAVHFYDHSAETGENSSDHTSSQFDKYMAGHINFTDVADEASFTLFPPERANPNVDYPTNAYQWPYEFRTNGNVVYHYNNWLYSTSIANWPPAKTEYYRDGIFFAVRIVYSGVNYYNYLFVTLTRGGQNGPSGGNENYGYSATVGFNFKYWRNQGIDAKLDEIDIPDPEDPNDEGEPSDEDGGDGTHQRDYDPIPIPPSPTQGAATAGFITLYKLHQAIMSQFASDCFASNLWEALKLFFSNPMDFLVGVNLLPFEPTGGPSYTPKFGAISFAHAYPSVANQYKDVDCGSVVLDKYWGSCFDFEPYTKIQIWLPYIGYRDLPVDEIMGSTVSVKYRCDCLTGDCVAFIYTGVVGQTGPQVERVIAQFYGNCAVRVPFGSVSFDNAISNAINLVGAAASGGLAKGVPAAMETGGAVGGLVAGGKATAEDVGRSKLTASAVSAVEGCKPSVMKGGAAGASSGYMSVQVPYLIRRIPNQNLPSNYKDLKGYPCNIGGILSDFPGLAVVDDIQLNNIPALEEERKEIISWLRGGVLV